MPLAGCNLIIGEQAWRIEAEDAGAAPVVARFAAAMQLEATDGAGSGGFTARRVRVISHDSDDAIPDGLVCRLEDLSGEDALFCHLLELSLVVGRDALAHGYVLLHAALAEYAGKGVILAAPGGIGKTTASKRLPPPWVAWCDDTTLVRRDAQGRYWAHPWPTWSTFLWGGQGGSWKVQSAIPLERIYFLKHNLRDSTEGLGAGQTLALLTGSAQQISHAMERGMSEADKRTLHLERFNHLSALAKAVPAGVLHISLSGAFWRENRGGAGMSEPQLDPTGVVLSTRPTPARA